MSGLDVTPRIEATAQIRRASSACCGAKLDPGSEPGTFTCQQCGQPCERVLSAPEEVIFRG